jgi:hypothetical protein
MLLDGVPTIFGDIVIAHPYGGLHVLKCRWALALSTLVALALPAFGQDTANLKWKFEVNKPFYQEMTTTTNQTMKVMNSDVVQKQAQTFYFSWTPTAEDKDGNWTIKQTIEGVKMNINIGGQNIDYDSTKEATAQNPLGDFFKQLVSSSFTLTLDKGMKVTKIDGRADFIKKLAAANPQMEPLLNQILSEQALKDMADPTFAAIPNKEVKKDESWTKESKLDMGPIGTYETSYKYTYAGKNTDGATDQDKKLDKIKVETTLKYNPPDPAANSPLPFKIKQAELTSKDAGGTILFNAEKGRIESSSMHLTLTGKLKIEIGGQTTDVDLTQTQTTEVKTSDKNPVEKKP